MNKVKQFFYSIYEFLFVDKTAKKLNELTRSIEVNYDIMRNANSEADKRHFSIMEKLHSITNQSNSLQKTILKELKKEVKKETVPNKMPEPNQTKSVHEEADEFIAKENTNALFDNSNNDRRTKNWSTHGLRLVKKMSNKNKSTNEIAESLGVTPYMVKKALAVDYVEEGQNKKQ